jgi:hypothetical protein
MKYSGTSSIRHLSLPGVEIRQTSPVMKPPLRESQVVYRRAGGKSTVVETRRPRRELWSRKAATHFQRPSPAVQQPVSDVDVSMKSLTSE